MLLVSLTGCSALSDSNSKEKEVSLEEAKKIVRTLYYDRQQAWNKGTEEGLYFDAAHNYPGAFDAEESKKCAIEYGWVRNELKLTQSVDPETLAPDENWTGPVTNERDYLFAGKKPEGQTFIVTHTESYADNFTPSTAAVKSDVHVTILNGQAYFYIGSCQ